MPMRVTVCGSIKRHKDLMKEYRKKLELAEHEVFTPSFTWPALDMSSNYHIAVDVLDQPHDPADIPLITPELRPLKFKTVSGRELEEMCIRTHWRKVMLADAILVVNDDCYVGPNTLFDIAVAMLHHVDVFTSTPIMPGCNHPSCQTIIHFSGVFPWA
jgi:hypothetical protein